MAFSTTRTHIAGIPVVDIARQFGTPTIFATPGPTGQPIVALFDARTAAPITSFAPFPAGSSTGIHISVENFSDGTTDLLVGAGYGGSPTFAIFDADTFNTLSSFNAFDPSFIGGVMVG